MSTFADNATVDVRSTRPLPGPGHRFPSLDFTLTVDATRVSGKTANAIKDALPHTVVTEEDVDFTVVEQGSNGTDPGDALVDAVGQSTAENLAAAGFPTLESARAAADEELKDVKLVGESTIENKIRDSGGSDGPTESGEGS